MPYFRDENLEDKDQQGGVQLSSAGTQADPSGNPVDAGNGSSDTKSGSHFQNLDTYLKNNNAKGAGEKFGQNVQNSIDQAKQTIGQTAGEVTNQINGGANPASQEQITGAIKGAGTYGAPDQSKQYQGWLNQSYQGPHSLADNAGAQGKIEGAVNTANTNARLAGTESGRFSLLDQFYGRPSYNFGEKSLDNALIERGGGFNNQPELRDQASQLGSYASEQGQAVQNAASQRAAQYDQSVNAAKSGLQGAFGQIDADAQAAAAANQAAKQTQLKRYQEELNRGSVEQGLLDRLGLSNGQSIYNTNLSKYVSENPDYKITAQNSIDPQQVQRLMALEQLMGGNQIEGASDIATKYGSNPDALANTNNQDNWLSYDKKGLSDELASQEGGYKKAVADNRAQYAGIQHEASLRQNEIPKLRDMGYSGDEIQKRQNQIDAMLAQLRQLDSELPGIDEKYGAGKKLGSASYNAAYGARPAPTAGSFGGFLGGLR